MLREGDEAPSESVETVRKELHERGGGVSLHFDASFATEYNLDSETEVVVEVVETDGKVSFEIDGIPAGFTHEDLVTFAENHNWSVSDEYADSERNEWFTTYRTESGTVAVELDSESQIDGNVVNNVTVRGDKLDITGDFDRYAAMCAAARRIGVDVRIGDSEGAWERLRGNPESAAADAPDRETFDQLSDTAEVVTARFVYSCSSLNTTLSDIGETAEAMERVYDDLRE